MWNYWKLNITTPFEPPWSLPPSVVKKYPISYHKQYSASSIICHHEGALVQSVTLRGYKTRPTHRGTYPDGYETTILETKPAPSFICYSMGWKNNITAAVLPLFQHFVQAVALRAENLHL